MNPTNNTELKSAEEWLNHPDCFAQDKTSGMFNVNLIRIIQLNAYKAGMTEAAQICKQNDDIIFHHKDARNQTKKIELAILAARDAKETI